MSQEIALLTQIRDLLQARPDIEQIYQLSSSQIYILDRKDRKHTYLYTTTVLSLSIEDFGTITTPSVGWIDITLKQGTRIYAQNQANPVPVLIRCTDTEIDTATDIQNVNATILNANPNGQASMANSSPVVLPSDQLGQRGNTISNFVFLDGFADQNGLATVGKVSDRGDGSPLTNCLAVHSWLTPDNATFSLQRTPSIFKTTSATASGDTAVWTPTGGKKFRLMRYYIELTSNASLAAGAILTIKFRDATTDININHSVFVPTTAITTGILDYSTGWCDLGNGPLSALTNNVLNINLSAALATGICRVIAIGTEE